MTELLAKPARPWALRLLPPFPAVANRVLALVGDPNVAAVQVSEIIKLDPSFTAEILRVANSALFGAAREIESVQQAITLLGMDRVKAMATLVAVHSMVKPALRLESLRKLWVHSLVTAILTEESSRASGSPADGAYTAGLLHHLGTLGLMAAYPDEYNRMLEVSQECGFDWIQSERDLFEIDHCAAGAYLAEEWNFPDAIVRAIATHHEDPVRAASLSNLVRIGWRLADALGFEVFPPSQPWTFEALLDLIPMVRISWLSRGCDEVRGDVLARLGSFGF